MRNADVRKRAIKALSEMLDDVSPEMREEAATALANLDCTEGATRIARLLEDDKPEACRCAALSLMKLGDAWFIDLLEKKSEDINELYIVTSVARFAATTLKRNVELK